MKKILFIPLALLVFTTIAQPKTKTIHNKVKVKELPDSPTVYQTNKYEDKVDGQIKGPKGEKVYIGPNGDRYYMKGTQRVNLSSRTSKKKLP